MSGLVKSIAYNAIGNHAFSRMAAWATRDRLRILAYHSVDDPGSFRRQIEYLTNEFHPVSSEEVVRSIEGGASLPARAAWVTFDDGDPSVVQNAIPILREFSIRSTMFVCPGLVGTDRPFWWQVVEEAERLGLIGEEAGTRRGIALLRWLKTLDDVDRRSRVDMLAARIEEVTGSVPSGRQLTVDQLKSFVDSGGSIGNHTWDHPLLNRCDTRTQRWQIIAAHDWLTTNVAAKPDLFAYPNGNHTPEAEEILIDLGYRIMVLFDHRLVGSHSTRARMSRLRTDALNQLPPFRAVVSGLHPVIMRLRAR